MPNRRVLSNNTFIDDNEAEPRLVLQPADDARTVKLDGVTLVILSWPKLAEGRGFTQARILREERGYRGRIRATGEVRHDALFFMRRCGIDEMILKDPEEEADALKAFETFSVLYQGAADESLPLWRRAR